MPCKRCTELSFNKDVLAEYKETVAKQSNLIRILKGDLGKGEQFAEKSSILVVFLGK